MITRLFRIRIKPDRRADFERDFIDISVSYVKKQAGYLSHTVGYPTAWQPNDYLLVINWRDEEALHAFAGEAWNKPVIPGGMEHYVVDCWVDHFVVDD